MGILFLFRYSHKMSKYYILGTTLAEIVRLFFIEETEFVCERQPLFRYCHYY